MKHQYTSAHEKIMKLREEFDIPEEQISEEDQLREKRERKAREIRVELAPTEDEYVAKWNRDPWTDEWLGPGPEVDPILEEIERKEGLTKKESKREAKVREEKIREEKSKIYSSPKKTVTLPDDEEDDKIVKKLRKQREKFLKKQKKQRSHVITPERQEEIDLAYWYLHDFLSHDMGIKVIQKYDNLDDLIDHASQMAKDWIGYNNDRVVHGSASDARELKKLKKRVEKAARIEAHEKQYVNTESGLNFQPIEVAYAEMKAVEIDESDQFPDIPEHLWNKFNKWCKKHPLKQFKKKAKKLGVNPMGYRRKVFLKEANKAGKKFRKDFADAHENDITSASMFMSTKELNKYIKKRKNSLNKQRQEFLAMIDDIKGTDHDEYDFSPVMTTSSGKVRGLPEEYQIRDTVIDPEKRYQVFKEINGLTQRQLKKSEKRERKYQKEREKWYNQYGGNLNDAFDISIDGKMHRLTKDDI